ncbi:hypothetical protein EVAR_515_1 [Eumeta japonica]|uniref:Secreted protein n=1 Tax=Eumeta variegata TaxID=151549 RepID=A0A4C1SAZ4_EUMVA|nr:hypothetical protein EVAR_515_1 [Eumeta japonica]
MARCLCACLSACVRACELDVGVSERSRALLMCLFARVCFFRRVLEDVWMMRANRKNLLTFIKRSLFPSVLSDGVPSCAALAESKVRSTRTELKGFGASAAWRRDALSRAAMSLRVRGWRAFVCS